MRTNNLVIRCYAKKDGNAWVAVAVDLSLAAQAESLEEAQVKLEQMIHSYITDAVTTDKMYARQLLTRKAPISQRLEYLLISMLSKFSSVLKNRNRTFDEVLPLVPTTH